MQKKRVLKQQSYLHPMNLKYIYTYKKQNHFSQQCVYVCHKSDNSYRVSKTAWYEHERQPATMQFENDKSTQHKMMSGYIFYSHHAVWDECNKQVHHQPKGIRITTRPKKEKRNRAGQWHVVIPAQISWQHISPRCLHCMLSSSLSDSALTCTCILMRLSPICQSAHSPMGGNSVSTTGMEKVTAVAVVGASTLNPLNYFPLLKNQWIFYKVISLFPIAGIT